MSEPSTAGQHPLSVSEHDASLAPVAAGDARAEDAKRRAASGLLRVAAAVREGAGRGGGTALASATAEALERGGRYLQEHDVAQVRDEVSTLVRRRPIEAVLVAAGVGFAGGALLGGRTGRGVGALGDAVGAPAEGSAADRLADLARRYGVDELVNDAVQALRGGAAEGRSVETDLGSGDGRPT